MPYTFKKTPMAYKDPTSEDYLPIELLSDGELPQKVAAVENSIAPNYDDLTFPVSEGEACMYNGSRYVANQNISTTEVWTAAHWTLSPVSAEISSLSNALSKNSENTNIAISAHTVGDLFWYNGTLHVAITAIAVGDTIVDTDTGANCKDTTISEALIKDVQINGTSILDAQGVANVPIAGSSAPGVLKVGVDTYGLSIDNGVLKVIGANDFQIKTMPTNVLRPILPSKEHMATFYGLAAAAGDSTQSQSSNAVGNYTETAKSKISDMFNAPETITGTTPSITAKAGILYVCGECATLDITAPASGEFGVAFDSGSTATVLTTTGITFQETFTPEANKHYEINVLNGYALVAEWDVSV